ncbi:MAG: alpha/beta hydrolase [Candidatus Portnoybacteria bacterium]|nr:alpha/beta hydrolase [Candidatus Portnoybacteria bacterium]
MKKQILVIHGGNAFKNQKEYLAYLKNLKIDIYWSEKWKAKLPVTLGKKFEVLAPKMPNLMNAKFNEWKIWFEKYFPYLRDNIILLGHSLGGIFLAKYLSENKFPKKIMAVFLIAAPCGYVNFELPKNLDKMSKQAGRIFIYHSQDDPIVPISEARKYKNLLPEAELVIFKNREHFNQENFPEIVKKIKSLKY